MLILIFILYDTDDLKFGYFCNKLMNNCVIANEMNFNYKFSRV